MKIWYKEDDTLERIILYLLLLNIFPVRWIDYRGKAMVVIAGLIVLDLLKYSFYYAKESFSFWFLLFMLYPFLNYMILGGSVRNLARNMYRLDKGILLILFFCILAALREDLLEKFLREGFLLFNAFALANCAVLLRQIGGDFRLTALRTGDLSQYYKPDLMSGLFGLYGTPCLAFFSVFIILYNLYISEYYFQGTAKALVRLYDLALAGAFMWFSVRNDNKGFFIIAAIYAVILAYALTVSRTYLEEPQIRWLKIAGSILLLAAVIAVAAAAAYNRLELFQKVVDMMIRKLQEGSGGNAARGGGERIGMLMFMLEEPSRIPFGYGLGQYYTANQTALGFQHFGQSDFGAFLCLGGLVYMVLIGVFLVSAFDSAVRHSALALMISASYMIFAVYTQVLINGQTLTLSLMAFTVILLWHRREKNKVINNDKDRHHYLP